jgi:hypothetical protein
MVQVPNQNEIDVQGNQVPNQTERGVQGTQLSNMTDVGLNQMVASDNRDTMAGNPLLIDITGNSPTSRKDRMQREAIINFLVDGLNQLINSQSNAAGSIAIPNSIIKIDLAALGIESLNIAINMPTSQQNALKTSSSATALFAQDNHNGQPFRNQHFSYAKPQTKATPITKVYYRKRFKGHAGNFEKQTGDVFPDFQEHSATINPRINSCKGKGKETKPKKRMCVTPISTLKLRRSPRFIKKTDGFRPEIISPKKAAAPKNKIKGKKIQPQDDLLSNMLLPPSSQASEFPGLSTIEKFNDMGATYPEIPIVHIQKVAIDTCCIPPLEVTAELLAAGPEDAADPSGSGACST